MPRMAISGDHRGERPIRDGSRDRLLQAPEAILRLAHRKHRLLEQDA